MYAYIYEELLGALGKDEAVALMKRAIYRRGLEVGRKYRPAVEAADLIEVGSIFCDGSPCEGGAVRAGHRGDLGRPHRAAHDRVSARRGVAGMGLPAEEVDTLCEIAAAVDEGTFEGAGLDLEFLSRIGASVHEQVPAGPLAARRRVATGRPRLVGRSW